MISLTELASSVALHRTAGPNYLIVDADREQMAVALVLQGYDLGRAHGMCFDSASSAYIGDNDGALQMLARHRVAAGEGRS